MKFPSEIKELVSANKWHNGKTIAYDVDTDEHSPLRAAMILFLMMQDK